MCKQQREEWQQMRSERLQRDRVHEILEAMVKSLIFILHEMGNHWKVSKRGVITHILKGFF